MTDEQIDKSLDICGNDGNCATCPYYRHVSERSADCLENLLLDAHNLINRKNEKIEELQQNLKEAHIDIKEHMAEIEILIRKKETLRDELAEKDAEIERLKRVNKDLAKEIYTSTTR